MPMPSTPAQRLLPLPGGSKLMARRASGTPPTHRPMGRGGRRSCPGCPAGAARSRGGGISRSGCGAALACTLRRPRKRAFKGRSLQLGCKEERIALACTPLPSAGACVLCTEWRPVRVTGSRNVTLLKRDPLRDATLEKRTESRPAEPGGARRDGGRLSRRRRRRVYWGGGLHLGVQVLQRRAPGRRPYRAVLALRSAP